MDGYGANALYRELKHAAAILRVAAAENRLALIMARLRLHLKAGFDPNQPREPAGQPTGGRWTRVDVAQIGSTRHPSFYYFDLRAIDSRRSHAWKRHVEKTPEQLLISIWSTYKIRLEPDGRIKEVHQEALGSFLTEEQANNFVALTLQNFPELVERAVAGDNRVQVTHDFGYQTGIEAFWPEEAIVPIIRPTRAVRVLIAHDPRPGTRGYIVITAFPMNDVSDEVFNEQYQDTQGL